MAEKFGSRRLHREALKSPAMIDGNPVVRVASGMIVSPSSVPIRRWVVLAIVITAALIPMDVAAASDFAATLQVRSPAGKANGVEISPDDVSSRLAHRPVLPVKVGQRLCATWSVTCTANKRIPNILVHFYVAGEKAAGQREAPDLSKPNVAVEGAVMMDFDPKDHTSATTPFALGTPGAYRVQVEAIDQGPKHEQRCAATLDVVVKGGDS